MKPDFRFTRLEVENFRGLPKLSIQLPTRRPTYLIGANNSGKSTVLNALALALRGGGFYRFTPNEFDFFIDSKGERSKTFEVRLCFEADDEAALPAVQGVGAPTFVHGIVVDGREVKGLRFEHRTRLYDKGGNPVTFSVRTQIAAKKKKSFKGQDVGWAPRNARLQDIREELPEVWRLTPENLTRSLYDWKTGPLQRLSRILTERFLSDDWEFELDGTTRRMPETLHRVYDFYRASVTAFPFWKDDLRPKLEEKLSEYLGRQGRIHLQPMVQSIEEWLAQQLATSFAADQGGAVTPLDRMGKGWQSLVRLAVLDTLRTFPDQMREKVFLLFEEPETFLHPHLRRKLRSVLQDLAQSGWQVVSATHAPEFISFADDQQIVRLWRDGNAVRVGGLETPSLPAGPKFQELIDEQGNHEFLFSNKAIFCEGKDDVLAIRTYLRKTNTDLDGRGVTVLGVGGVETLPHYVRMAQSLGIAWLVVTDEDLDPKTNTVKPSTKKVRAEISMMRSAQDDMAMWPVSLEQVLHLPPGKKAKPDWQRTNLLPLSFSNLKQRFPGLQQVGEQVAQWIRA